MDISSLLTRPSLADYLSDGKGRNEPLIDLSKRQSANRLAQSALLPETSQTSAVQVDLSPEAQALLEQQKQSEGESSTLIQNAKKHFLQFFEDSDIDLENLSADASELIQGILDIIEQSGTTGRDLKTDTLEKEYSKGERDVYTLTGADHRLRVAIEEQTDGTQKLTVTDIQAGTADIAEFTLEQGTGQNILINIERKQEKFAYGQKTESNNLSSVQVKTPAQDLSKANL